MAVATDGQPGASVTTGYSISVKTIQTTRPDYPSYDGEPRWVCAGGPGVAQGRLERAQIAIARNWMTAEKELGA